MTADEIRNLIAESREICSLERAKSGVSIYDIKARVTENLQLILLAEIAAQLADTNLKLSLMMSGQESLKVEKAIL